MAVKQTAGREALGKFAPKFAELNDDVLFGQVWSRENKLSLRDRSIVTVVALMAQGLTDSSFQYHLTTAKNNGVTKTEIAEILTHSAFYAGWPKAWAAFRMAKEVWAENDAADAKAKHQNEMVFPIGAPNDGFAKYFIGQSYLAPLSTQQVPELRPAAIYSRSAETGRAFAEKYHLDAVYTDLEAFAAADTFDAAYIASPNRCHFEQALCLLRHGKHVLLEKPGVLTAAQTGTLIETAKEHRVVYLEAMRLVFDDALPIIRDALPEIGTLRRVTAEFTQ